MREAFIAAVVLLLTTTVADAESGTVKGTVSSTAGPVADAVVMIDTQPQGISADAPHAVMEQHDTTFVPHVLAVPAGTTVDFPNHDPFLHNVVSSSPARRFDLGMYPEGETKSVTF